MKIISRITLYALLPMLLSATIWYVHPDSSLNTIQAGLDSCVDNDIVLVGPGTYYENLIWPETEGIHLTSELGPEYTIIDGDLAGSVISCSTPIDTTTLIRGFIVKNGFAGRGGGINLNAQCNPKIDNVIITENGGWFGGGIYCNGANPVITNTIIEYNSATSGGGLFLTGNSVVVIDNISVNNCIAHGAGPVAALGGGIRCDSSTLMIKECSISHNETIYQYNNSGAGVFVKKSTLIVDSSTISYNYNTGITCSPYDSSIVEIHNSHIFGNGGYGIYNITGPCHVSAEYNWWGDSTGPYHPVWNPGGLGDTVSEYVDIIPWLYWPGVEEQPTAKPVVKYNTITSTIFAGPLILPEGKNCKVIDITGRVVLSDQMKPGIYFIQVDDKIVHKVIKVR